MDKAVIRKVHGDLIESINALTEGKPEGHLAIKLTSMITIDIMTRLSHAQGVFLEDILQLWGPETITKEDIKAKLNQWNITFKEKDIEDLWSRLKFSDNTGDSLSRVERYANGHLLSIFPENRSVFNQHIATKLGVTADDLSIFETFSGQVVEITALSHQRNCLLYVDAEQSYMQRGLDSIAHQLTHRYNRGDKVIIMNGF